jgi:hypothetical protein
MALRLLALRTGRALFPTNIIFLLLVFISVRDSKPHGLVRQGGLGKLKQVIHFIGSRSHDLQACSIVPQPLRYRVNNVLAYTELSFVRLSLRLTKHYAMKVYGIVNIRLDRSFLDFDTSWWWSASRPGRITEENEPPTPTGV